MGTLWLEIFERESKNASEAWLEQNVMAVSPLRPTSTIIYSYFSSFDPPHT
jgi:hypothetical protein